MPCLVHSNVLKVSDLNSINEIMKRKTLVKSSSRFRDQAYLPIIIYQSLSSYLIIGVTVFLDKSFRPLNHVPPKKYMKSLKVSPVQPKSKLQRTRPVEKPAGKKETCTLICIYACLGMYL